MMEGSKTGKAAEADLMLLIGKTMQVEGEDEDPVRYLNLAKNKLNGYLRHGKWAGGELFWARGKETARRKETNYRRAQERANAPLF